MATQFPPPQYWDTLPALFPPDGVACCNFDHPEDQGYILVVVGTVLLVLTVGFYGARVYAKSMVIKQYTWDDLTCSIAFVLALAYYGIQIWSVTSGPVGKHQWDVRISAIASDAFLIADGYLTGVLLSPTMLVTKMSFFILYYELFRPLRWMRIAVWIGGIFTTICYTGLFITTMVLQTPRRNETWLEHAVSAMEREAQWYVSIPAAAIGFAIDLYLLVLPLVAVNTLQIKGRRKFGVMLVFLSGALACVASVLSIYYRVLDNNTSDTTWGTLYVGLVALVEVFIGIIVSCMPSVSKLLQVRMPGVLSLRGMFSRLTGSRTGGSSRGTGPSQSYATDDTLGSKRRDYRMVAVPSDASLVDHQQFSAYDLGHPQRVQTFIGAGGGRPGPYDDKVHLTREINQTIYTGKRKI